MRLLPLAALALFSGCASLDAPTPPPAPSPFDRADASRFYDSGREKRAEGDLPGALKDFSKAVQLRPRYADAYVARGITREDAGPAAPVRKFGGATPIAVETPLEDFNDALRSVRRHPDAWSDRAQTRRLQGENDGALADLDASLRLWPHNLRARFRRACLHYDMQKWSEALADFRKRLEYAAHPASREEAMLRIWLIRARIGQRREATDELAGWEIKDATSAAVASYFAGKTSEQHLLAKFGGDSDVLWYVATVRLIDGDRKGARALFEECARKGTRGSAAVLSAEAELRR